MNVRPTTGGTAQWENKTNLKSVNYYFRNQARAYVLNSQPLAALWFPAISNGEGEKWG